MELIRFLPDYYEENQTMQELQEILSEETDLLDERLQAIIEECAVMLASELLERYEKIFGLDTEAGKSDVFRRERIAAKISGRGTTTKEMIKDVASRYSGGEVEIIEDNPNSRFTVKFVGTIGLPPNMEDLTDTIEEIKPAHLAFDYEYVYNTHASLGRFTHAQLTAYTHDQLRNEVIKNGE